MTQIIHWTLHQCQLCW